VRYECPACKRSFNEPGFCPYDGKPLAATTAADNPTVLSAIHRAQSDAETIQKDQTAPPPSTVSGIGDTTHKVHAVSGRDDATGRAKAALKDRVNEYDRLVGETLDGRYFVKEKLGEGGMGVVFAARHAVIERPLAIKVLKREATRDAATIQRFVQEAKASSRIGHPNIVEVTDFGTTPEGLTYSVMELVDGTTLAKTIKASAPFPPERAVRIASQIARALGAAHTKGIVHRDLKPENVFLIDRDGRPDFVKIVDFGIAKVQPLPGSAGEGGPRLTRTGSVFGTPEYMAPEQAAGRSDTDQRVDIYALGTILYEMIVGKVPHKGGSMVRTIAMQMLDPIKPPREVNPEVPISPQFEGIIMKALAKNRDERFQTMAELLAALESVSHELQNPAATLSLPPVPPGAEPGAERRDATPTPLPPTIVADAPRRARPLTKQLHEPEFVAGGPLSLHAFEDEPLPEPTRRWPYALLAVVVVVGGGAALFVALRGGGDDRVAEVAHDAGSAAGHADAHLIAEVPLDAAAAPDDAAVIAMPRDAGARTVRDGGPIGPHPAKITIEVLTSPSETDIFVGHTFLGPSGTHLERPWGTKMTIECRAPHYHGKKTIVFDGSVTSVMCPAKRLKMCVEGLKNPYDECEEPTGGSSQQGPVTRPTP
jgi:serine/threonine-protein kinase